jgi:hypothetical protein
MDDQHRFHDKDLQITELPRRETMFKFFFKFRGLKFFFGL